MDTFSNMPNTQREDANAVFTREKLDKLDKLADGLKYLTINNSVYYASNSVTVSDPKGNLTRDPKTVTHTSNGK